MIQPGPWATRVEVGVGCGVKVGVMVGVGVMVAVAVGGRGVGVSVGGCGVDVAVGAAMNPPQPDNKTDTPKASRIIFFIYRLSSQRMRRPSRVSQGAMCWMTGVSLATTSASPPVATTCMSSPSSARKRATMPSTMLT